MRRAILPILFLFSAFQVLRAQYPPGDHWYNNPLGFSPVELHTKNGFLLPAIAVGACLLLTDRDSSHGAYGFYAEGTFAEGYKFPYTSMNQANLGVNVFLRRWMSVGGELDMYSVTDDYNNTTGIAGRLFARFYPVNEASWRLYFESGGGLVWFAEEFPKPTPDDERLGTQVNGTTKYGIGGEVNVTDKLAILMGIRHIHVSNGNTSGVERNPSHDSNGWFLGVAYMP
jgi:opacity protein-like surface antigen